jgi:hypothetical protein
MHADAKLTVLNAFIKSGSGGSLSALIGYRGQGKCGYKENKSCGSSWKLFQLTKWFLLPCHNSRHVGFVMPLGSDVRKV